MNRSLILGVAGHIDHGKTALVRALTGMDTDRLPQEKQRGITIDIGFARLDLNGLTLGVVDAPGHERFVRNMLAGATGVDIALLVISADEGVMPQTREHLAILDLLGVERGVVALTKRDMVEEEWAALVGEEVREELRGSFLSEAPIVHTSAATGEGLDALREALAAQTVGAERPGGDGPFRLAIDRSFTKEGLGTIVTGTVWSGRAHIEEAMELQPGGRSVRVRGLHSHGEARQEVGPGQRAAIQLAGAHHSEIRRGDELAAPGALRPAKSLIVRLRCLPSSPWPIRHRGRVRLHLGAQEVIATVRLLEGLELAPGEHGCAQLLCAEPAIATARQPFVVRSESPVLTIGGGRVLHPGSARVRRGDTGTIARLLRLDSADAVERVGEALRQRGLSAWTELDLWREAGVSGGERDQALASLRSHSALPRIRVGASERAVHVEAVEQARDRIRRALTRLHEEQPTSAGFPLRTLAQRVRSIDEAAMAGLCELLRERGELEGAEDLFALPGRSGTLTTAQRALLERALDAFHRGGFTPPSVDEIASSLSAPTSEVRAMVDRAVQMGDLVHIGGPVHLHREHAETLRLRTMNLLAERPEGISVGDLRDALGTSRKYVIPICEHLDRVRLTKRRGDLRVAGQAAERELLKSGLGGSGHE